MSVSPLWVLFQDWCTAAGLPALPTNAEVIAEFFREVPAAPATRVKRLQVIRRIHRDAGASLALPASVPGLWREGEGWLDLAGTLARCPVRGWTAGLAGRRDGYLAVLAGACRFTREQARTVAAADINQDREANWSIRGIPLARTPEPEACPACAVARWLDVLILWEDRGRASVRSWLAGCRPDGEHACLEPSGHLGLDPGTVLLPAIDQHGWLADWEPVTARTVSAILAYRQDASRPPAPEAPDRPEREGQVREDYQRASLEELAGILDELDAKAAEALRDSEAVIEETLAMLERIGGR
ncbi:hypothetical protein [Arthrobacter mobilis]|uniref:Uncharacterized protein n=1 Tax=Arthrobacter mobilis TaxID=2724944 RepID=A0A7X6K6T5_9MICC|nr:hypothetical protein [Arthrobacter mobilis]NKX55940.1 hypothetical protein [Arthrobacter mobilis]